MPRASTAGVDAAAAAAPAAADADAPPAAASAGGDSRLAALRAAMAAADGGRGVDAFIIPTEDSHMVSEELPCVWFFFFFFCPLTPRSPTRPHAHSLR
jgi:hypothetical protein